MSRTHTLLTSIALFSAGALAADLDAIAGESAVNVEVVSLQVSRPVVVDPFEMPGTTIALEVTLEGSPVLGLGADSAIKILRDDTGHDLLAEGTAREAEVLGELMNVMEGMLGGGGTITRKNIGGNIDHERAANLIDRERNAIQVPVMTLGLPARGATRLQLKGELAIEVAAPGERRIRVDNVTAEGNWLVVEVEVDGKPITCNPSDYVETDDGTITVYQCREPRLIRAEVIGKAPPAPPGEYGPGHFFVWGVPENLSVEFIFPKQKTVRVPVDLEFGVGL
jgi:hypothetical protein